MIGLKAKIYAVLAILVGLVFALFKAFSLGKDSEKNKNLKAENKQLKDYTEAMNEAEKEANELVKNAESRGDDDRRDVHF